jgi:hypothetical protein
MGSNLGNAGLDFSKFAAFPEGLAAEKSTQQVKYRIAEPIKEVRGARKKKNYENYGNYAGITVTVYSIPN